MLRRQKLNATEKSDYVPFKAHPLKGSPQWERMRKQDYGSDETVETENTLMGCVFLYKRPQNTILVILICGYSERTNNFVKVSPSLLQPWILSCSIHHRMESICNYYL